MSKQYNLQVDEDTLNKLRLAIMNVKVAEPLFGTARVSGNARVCVDTHVSR